MCLACIAKIRADGFQKGYKLGFDTGVSYENIKLKDVDPLPPCNPKFQETL